MPISLKAASGGGSSFRYDLAVPTDVAVGEQRSSFKGLSITGVNVSTALTEMFSINVPSGYTLLMLKVGVAGLGSTGDLNFELEADGAVKLFSNNTSYTFNSATLLGQSPNTNDASAMFVTDTASWIPARQNMKLRVKRAGATSATVNYTYILVRS